MDRIVVVTKKTPLQELVRKYHTEGAARFALESEGEALDGYQREHAVYAAALALVSRQIPSDVQVSYVERDELPNFLFREKDLVVAIGPDGLFANLAQYVGEQPILGVNPGVFGAGKLMLFSPQQVAGQLSLAAAGTHTLEALPLAKAEVGGKVLWGINDIFIGRKDRVSARYELSHDGQSETQSSDGILVSTGVGSSGWLRSVITMVEGLMEDRAPHLLSHLPTPTDEELVFVVQNPFPLTSDGVSVITGRVTEDSPLTVRSKMPRGGYLFSDGMVDKGLEWHAGTEVTVTVGERYVQRMIP